MSEVCVYCHHCGRFFKNYEEYVVFKKDKNAMCYQNYYGYSVFYGCEECWTKFLKGKKYKLYDSHKALLLE